jgi:hypothetical protein
MPNKPLTVYANVVNFRLTPAEFVLEFGSHFPDHPRQAPPSDFGPDVRIVLPASALEKMAKALARAVEQRRLVTTSASPSGAPKQTAGFQGPSESSEKDKS